MQIHGINIGKFAESYIDAALWSSTESDSDKSLSDNNGIDAIHPDDLRRMIADCDDFYEQNYDDLDSLDDGKTGYYFWMTRSGNGVSFTDGDYDEEVGERLEKSAKTFSERALYVGDDGKVYECSA